MAIAQAICTVQMFTAKPIKNTQQDKDWFTRRYWEKIKDDKNIFSFGNLKKKIKTHAVLIIEHIPRSFR